MIWRYPVIDIGAAACRDESPGPAARGQELIHDHLANVEFRPVHRPDTPPPGMRPNQYLLDKVVAPGRISGQHCSKPLCRGKVASRELVKCHCTSAVGSSCMPYTPRAARSAARKPGNLRTDLRQHDRSWGCIGSRRRRLSKHTPAGVSAAASPLSTSRRERTRLCRCRDRRAGQVGLRIRTEEHPRRFRIRPRDYLRLGRERRNHAAGRQHPADRQTSPPLRH
jgi:hypothetical protein